MKRQSLYFCGVEQVQVREEPLTRPGEGQVLVQTAFSAISPGTEMLFYRGQVLVGMEIDATISALSGAVRYPFKYGYACVGRVVETGPGVSSAWAGRRVFAFHPHESLFTASPDDLLPIPDGISYEDAIFLPNMETAVNLVMDGQPQIGEAAAVFGLGVVGLLTLSLLARFPLAALVGFDRYSLRRAAGEALGAACLDPAGEQVVQRARELLQPGDPQLGADLAYEVSGSPEALNQALALTGFAGRVVIGSWYGSKRAPVDLGGTFHRSRIRLISSQVSTIAPEWSGRWSKARRMAAAWDAIERLGPSRWISRSFEIGAAEEAYRQVADRPDEVIQVALRYA